MLHFKHLVPHDDKNLYRHYYMYRGKRIYRLVIKVKCWVCGTVYFKYYNSRCIKKNYRNVCCQRCKNIIMSGKNSKNWCGGTKFKNGSKGGYILSYAPKHPRAVQNFVPQHRLLIEKKLDRYLKKDEFIHHINCNKQDNRLSNLIIVKQWQHNAAHKAIEICVEKLMKLGYIKFDRKKLIYRVVE